MIELDFGEVGELAAVRRAIIQLEEEKKDFQNYVKNLGDPNFEEDVTKVEFEWHKGSNFVDFEFLIN